jgi:HD superfamily phosphodiesterase
VEFFKDDSTRKCLACGNRFANPKLDLGCAAYCPYAAQCLEALPAEVVAENRALLKDRVAVEMKRYFGKDFKRIGHAAKVAEYAEKIAKEAGGDLGIILCAAYLHDIGIHEAERKHQSTAARYQHEEGPPIANRILSRLGADEALIKEVCDIVGHHHHPRDEETTNFKVLYDADLIVNLEERQKERAMKIPRVEEVIDRRIFTEAGKRLAETVLMGEVS